jgi:hypothetical protein
MMVVNPGHSIATLDFSKISLHFECHDPAISERKRRHAMPIVQSRRHLSRTDREQ